jgi:thiamine biosynthesis protein ThiI
VVVSRPVFRPLIGFDKIDIIDYAVKIDTYETSCLPYEDCCTVFTPKHPITHPKLDKTQIAESVLDIEALIEEAMQGIEIIEL